MSASEDVGQVLMKATMAGLSNWKLSVEVLHIADLGIMVVCCCRTTTVQGGNPGDQAALSSDLPSTNLGTPLEKMW